MYRTAAVRGGLGEHDLSEAAIRGGPSSTLDQRAAILPIRLGSQQLGNLALNDPDLAPPVLEGIASLVAVGLERARAQELAEQIEASRQSEKLRTTLIDAMAHEFKTPLTLIKGATSSLLASPDGPLDIRKEQLSIADEEAEHLRKLIDDAIEMALSLIRISRAYKIKNLQRSQATMVPLIFLLCSRHCSMASAGF